MIDGIYQVHFCNVNMVINSSATEKCVDANRAISPQKHMAKSIFNISKIKCFIKDVHNAIVLADSQIPPNSI